MYHRQSNRSVYTCLMLNLSQKIFLAHILLSWEIWDVMILLLTLKKNYDTFETNLKQI